jgi:hypothetical protein
MLGANCGFRCSSAGVRRAHVRSRTPKEPSPKVVAARADAPLRGRDENGATERKGRIALPLRRPQWRIPYGARRSVVAVVACSIGD